MTITEKLDKIEANEQRVFDAGKQAEYDAFWDACQDNGNRIDYNNSFGGMGWNNKNFLPKHNLTMGASNNAFYFNRYDGSLKELLYKQGITLTFPKNYNMSNMFSNTLFTEIGVLDFSTIIQAASKTVFSGSAKLHTIEKIILPNSLSLSFVDWFNNCSALESIAFEGEIANDINFQWSPLSVASMKSIISCLKNYSGTDYDGTYSLTFSDTCWAALEADSSSPNGGLWKDYVTDLGWNT